MTLEKRIHAVLKHELDFLAAEQPGTDKATIAKYARQEVKHYINGIIDKWTPEVSPD